MKLVRCIGATLVPQIERIHQQKTLLREDVFKAFMRAVFAVGLLLIVIFGVMTPMPGGATGLLSTYDKFTHEVSYGGLAVLGLLAGYNPVWLSLGLILHGSAVEVLQSMTLFRSGDWMDLWADVAGVTAIMAGRAIFSRIWKP